MLHILLLILKIIGWILLAILGILVLLVLIVLFVPLRYQADGECGGTIDSLYGNIKVSWLAHLISCRVTFEKGMLKWKIRLVFKNFSSETAGKTKKPEEEADTAMSEAAVQPKEVIEPEEMVQQKLQLDECTAKEELETAFEKAVEHQEISEEENQKKTDSKPQAWYKKIKGIFRKIKYTWETFCAKIKLLLEKKETLITFVEDEIHVNAFLKLKKELFRLCRFLMPRKLILNIHFGFEDPYHTGQALAGLSVLYPFMGEYISVIPDFEQRILEGSVKAKGRVHFLYFIIIAWNLFWDKNVRTTYKHIRTFKF